MAYLGQIKGKWHIIGNIGDLECEVCYKDLYDKDTSFQIDEMMALPVMELLNKGYMTTACCSEHYFDYLTSNPFNEEEGADSASLLSYHDDDGGGVNIYLAPSEPVKAVLVFMKEYSFPVLPTGWIQDGSKLFSRYTKTSSPYDFFEERLIKHSALYDWAKALPDIKETGPTGYNF